jgi:glutamyl-Q tRNA(Asp) synthetase
LGSFLSAKSKGGRWLVRIEDVDSARNAEGADGEILRQLEDFALFWDGEIVYQSKRIAYYRAAIELLGDAVYACGCSRADLAPFGGVHPAKCPRRRQKNDGENASLRLSVSDETIGFRDALCGYFEQNLRKDVGDFALFNALGEPTYQLAVVVDDEFSGVNEIARGRDLLDSTPRQIFLRRLLGFSAPIYAHLPLALGSDGQKLSKQNLAKPIEAKNASQTLIAALDFLGYNPPLALAKEKPTAIVDWALATRSVVLK